MALSTVCPVRAARRRSAPVAARTSLREAMRLVAPGAHRARGQPGRSAPPATSAARAARPTATAAAAAPALDQGRRRRAAHPQAARGLASSRRCSSRAGASTGPSGRSSWRPTSTACRRARSTTSSWPWASRRASRKSEVSRICRRARRGRRRPSASGRSTTSASPTSSSTPRTSRPTRAPRSCPRPSSSPPG